MNLVLDTLDVVEWWSLDGDMDGRKLAIWD